MSNMNSFIDGANELANIFREKYVLGNYCANQMFEILGLIEQSERIKIKLIRTPFENLNLAGFIGYKYDSFIIVINTNHTIGSQRFTVAHEIYHLLNDRLNIKDNYIYEEIGDNSVDFKELRANAFAAELLMPKESINQSLNQFYRNQQFKIDEDIVVRLQHKYGVDYIAITRRLKEMGIITEEELKKLHEILNKPQELKKITKNLGYDNKLNEPTRDKYLSPKELQIIKDNYNAGYTSYDDLVRLFNYLGCEPENFGYENTVELTDEAKNFMNSLLE